MTFAVGDLWGPDGDENLIASSCAGEYEGELRGGKPHGSGTMRYDCGYVYTGMWADGFFSGSGTLLQLSLIHI